MAAMNKLSLMEIAGDFERQYKRIYLTTVVIKF